MHFKQAVDNVSAEMITMKGKRNTSGAVISDIFPDKQTKTGRRPLSLVTVAQMGER